MGVTDTNLLLEGWPLLTLYLSAFLERSVGSDFVYKKKYEQSIEFITFFKFSVGRNLGKN